jgi:hypothetical protein
MDACRTQSRCAVAVGELRPGDILACSGRGWTGRLIQFATASLLAPAGLRVPPSHVAIVCRHHAATLWVESTTLCPHPCLLRGRVVSGAQAHLPEARLHDYEDDGGTVDIYRLVPIDTLSSAEAELLRRILIEHFVLREIGYDLGGAALSGTRLLQLTRLFPGACLEQLFCSELIAAVLMRLGRLNRANPTCFNPGRLLRTLVRQGTYFHAGRLREDEP